VVMVWKWLYCIIVCIVIDIFVIVVYVGNELIVVALHYCHNCDGIVIVWWPWP
jgi:hypothetical protein